MHHAAPRVCARCELAIVTAPCMLSFSSFLPFPFSLSDGVFLLSLALYLSISRSILSVL